MTQPVVIVEELAPPITLVTAPPAPPVVFVAPPGPKGPKGDQGDVGPTGPTGGDPLQFTQSVPSDTWTITHGLGFLSSVTVIDSAHQEVYGDVEFPDSVTVVLHFASAFSGTAYLI